MKVDVAAVKKRFGIIGFDPKLDYAIEIATKVAPTDLSVLITGESGVGKENFSKIIHDYSAFKHAPFIPINCGAIPEGTIDSELFGHEKGAFTGAIESRKGYFEVANGGTLFLDEVADLPLATQVRLLRVLENGEFIKVGSNKVQKTQVRIVAATNVNIHDRIAKGKFREDLYYRLNAVPIFIPPLRERKEDIFLIFTKFANDFAVRSKVPAISLSADAKEMLANHYWSGNIRQLKNVAEQISVIEKERVITSEILATYLASPTVAGQLAIVEKEPFGAFEKEMILKYLQDLTMEVGELRKRVALLQKNDDKVNNWLEINSVDDPSEEVIDTYSEEHIDAQVEELTVINTEKDQIMKTLQEYGNNRKLAAAALGISERTLYRKIKDLKI